MVYFITNTHIYTQVYLVYVNCSALLLRRLLKHQKVPSSFRRLFLYHSSHHFLLLCFKTHYFGPSVYSTPVYNYRTEIRRMGTITAKEVLVGIFFKATKGSSTLVRNTLCSTRSWSTRSTWYGYWSTTEVVWGVSFAVLSIDQPLLSLNPSRSCYQGIALWLILCYAVAVAVWSWSQRAGFLAQGSSFCLESWLKVTKASQVPAEYFKSSWKAKKSDTHNTFFIAVLD